MKHKKSIEKPDLKLTDREAALAALSKMKGIERRKARSLVSVRINRDMVVTTTKNRIDSLVKQIKSPDRDKVPQRSPGRYE